MSPPRRLVIVEWIDSSSGEGWRPTDELATQTAPVRCQSVGWVLAETKEAIVLVAHTSGGHNSYREYARGDISIPKGCVTRVRKLKAR